MIRRIIVLGAILALAGVSVGAQRANRRLFVSVSGAATGLTAADFEVIENDAKRAVTRAVPADGPVRVILLVDSSSAMSQMLNDFRAALAAFLEALPAQHEVGLITTGGQIRIRAQPTTDRAKLTAEAARLASDGGANSLIDTLMETDRRFLKPAPNWPVFVIVTTDNGDTRTAPNIEDYNRFLDDFLMRAGSAHAVIVKGKNTGPVTEIVENLIQNTGGLYEFINLSTGLPERLKAMAERIAADHRKMANRWEIEYASDAKLQQPKVRVGIGRAGVTLQQISLRRPF
jgi:hypothetical protein